MSVETILLDEITERYLTSRDFNGTSMSTLAADQKAALYSLVEKGLASVIWEQVDVNPHILRHDFPKVEDQLEWLQTGDNHAHTCMYPTSRHLQSAVDVSNYEGRPFELELALGAPQLDFRTFELAILENYRNDPRYVYSSDDVSGLISVNSEFSENEGMADRDIALLQSFGFSYDNNLNRYVAVFLRYLSDLSPEHQTIWKARELKGQYFLHPDYYKSSILGQFFDHVSIFGAFCKELYLINKMSKAMGKPKLFREDFGEYSESRPKKLAFLIRPTLEEFNSFVLLFDKLVAENINKKWFSDDVQLEEEIERPDGKVEVIQKNTLRLLDEWMRSNFQTDDWEAWDESISAFRELRHLRRRPAHAVDEDLFDQKYFHQQRELVKKVYNGMRTIRLIFENHPFVKDSEIDVPDWLKQGLIRTR